VTGGVIFTTAVFPVRIVRNDVGAIVAADASVTGDAALVGFSKAQSEAGRGIELTNLSKLQKPPFFVICGSSGFSTLSTTPHLSSSGLVMNVSILRSILMPLRTMSNIP